MRGVNLILPMCRAPREITLLERASRDSVSRVGKARTNLERVSKDPVFRVRKARTN